MPANSSYFQLFVQAMQQMNDPELISVELEFQRQLCELCLCLLMVITKAQTATAELGFPADLFSGIVDYIPVVDIHEQTPQPDILQLLAVRDVNGKELSRGSKDVINYFDDSWISSNTTPIEYYMLMSNLIGVRKSPADNITLTLVYVPYVDIVSVDDLFPLDESYQSRYISLIKVFLLLRYSNFELAVSELKRALVG